jgi:hypothetical protein
VTGAVVYLILVALVARSPRPKELLGYSQMEELAPSLTPAAARD